MKDHLNVFPWVSVGGRSGVGKFSNQTGQKERCRGMNQLEYFPGLICYPRVLVQTVLWQGPGEDFSSEQRLREQILLAYSYFFIQLFIQLVEALLCSGHCWREHLFSGEQVEFDRWVTGTYNSLFEHHNRKTLGEFCKHMWKLSFCLFLPLELEGQDCLLQLYIPEPTLKCILE